MIFRTHAPEADAARDAAAGHRQAPDPAARVRAPVVTETARDRRRSGGPLAGAPRAICATTPARLCLALRR